MTFNLPDAPPLMYGDIKVHKVENYQATSEPLPRWMRQSTRALPSHGRLSADWTSFGSTTECVSKTSSDCLGVSWSPHFFSVLRQYRCFLSICAVLLPRIRKCYGGSTPPPGNWYLPSPELPELYAFREDGKCLPHVSATIVEQQLSLVCNALAHQFCSREIAGSTQREQLNRCPLPLQDVIFWRWHDMGPSLGGPTTTSRCFQAAQEEYHYPYPE